MNTIKALPRRCKSSTKEFLSVDIRKMHRQGQLRSDASTVITDGAGHAETQLVAQTDQVTIRHGIRLLAGFRELARQTVKLDKTPCHYGGERSWFRCSGCDTRVAVILRAKTRKRCFRKEQAVQMPSLPQSGLPEPTGDLERSNVSKSGKSLESHGRSVGG